MIYWKDIRGDVHQSRSSYRTATGDIVYWAAREEADATKYLQARCEATKIREYGSELVQCKVCHGHVARRNVAYPHLDVCSDSCVRTLYKKCSDCGWESLDVCERATASVLSSRSAFAASRGPEYLCIDCAQHKSFYNLAPVGLARLRGGLWKLDACQSPSSKPWMVMGVNGAYNHWVSYPTEYIVVRLRLPNEIKSVEHWATRRAYHAKWVVRRARRLTDLQFRPNKASEPIYSMPLSSCIDACFDKWVKSMDMDGCLDEAAAK